jgi:hypothetical protein
MGHPFEHLDRLTVREASEANCKSGRRVRMGLPEEKSASDSHHSILSRASRLIVMTRSKFFLGTDLYKACNALKWDCVNFTA